MRKAVATEAKQRNVMYDTPTDGKPSLLAHEVLPTVAFEAFRSGVKNSFKNYDKAERSLIAALTLEGQFNNSIQQIVKRTNKK